MIYTIRRTTAPPALDGNWDAPPWGDAETAAIASFLPEISDHRPRTQVRLLYDAQALHGIYRVEDRYVRCVQQGFQAPVCRDSCVEFFFRPHVGKGYLNAEFNCGGSFLIYHVRDWTRVGAGFADYSPLAPELGRQVGVWHSLPARVEPERTEPTVWFLQFLLPLGVIEACVGPLHLQPGTVWTANFYKCGDDTSKPHWASWNPVDEKNFHLPRCFGELRFGE